MKIGWRDIGHLAIIGAAGAMGVAATAAVVGWAEGTRDRVHADQRATVTVHAAPQVYVSTGAHQVQTGAYVRGQVQVAERVAERVQELAERRAAAVSERQRVLQLRATQAASPVIYLDGVRVRSLDDLAREDIAGVEVVKGEKAKERFGTEGAERGVILVTTKKGKKKAAEGAEKGR